MFLTRLLIESTHPPLAVQKVLATLIFITSTCPIQRNCTGNSFYCKKHLINARFLSSSSLFSNETAIQTVFDKQRQNQRLHTQYLSTNNY